MNNQSAQTMPELPEKSGRATIKVSPGKYQTSDLYTAAQMYQYARDYAALSQTAVVAEPGRYFAGGPQGHFFADDLQLARDLVNLYDKDDDWTITDLRNPTGAAPAASGGECHKPCTPIDFFNGDACPDCVTRDYSPQPPSAAPASGVHPDALPDGTLSKSTAKRLAAASVSERARAILKSEMGGFGTDTQGRIPLEYALRAIEQALTQHRGEREDAHKFRRLAQLLDGFDFRLGRNALMPPATYLDSVEITCEFQPGIGQSVIDAIMDTLTGADPT